MKKNYLFKVIALLGWVCLPLSFAACKAKEPIIKDATENYLQTSNSADIVKELFCKKSSISEIKENYTLKTADNVTKNGVLISTSTKNANLYYARPINLVESNDEIISFELPYTDTYQTSGIEITIVDIYDENNIITVRFGGYEYNELWSLVSAKNTNFNSFVGYNTHDVASGYADGTVFPYNNFIGKIDEGNYHYAFNLCYDSEENQVYLKLKGADNRLICDFDDEYFTEKSDLFTGFFSNNVYVNIKFTGLVKTGAIFVESIGGQSLVGTPDYTVPCDNIKIEGNGKGGFYAGAVGYKYTLPRPIESDFLMGEQTVDVFVKRLTDDVVINVDTDYSFIPTDAGEYKAVYNAKDIYGNDISKEFAFTVSQLPLDIDVEFEDRVYEIGDVALLPTVTLSGGSGNINYSVSYEYNGKQYNEIEKIVFSGVEDLIVKVIAEDGIGYKVERVKNYSILKKAHCYLESALPKAARIEETLTLPTLYAYDYLNDAEMDKKVYVNGALVENGKWTVQAEDGDNLLVEYYANKGMVNEQKISQNITVFNQNDSYFVYDKDALNREMLDEYTTFKAKNAISQFTVAYPYALSCDLLNISLLLGEHSKYSHIDLKLIDCVNGASITYRLKYEAEGVVIAVRDEEGEFTTEVLATKYLENVGEVNVYYSNAEGYLLNYNYNEMIKANYTDDGEEFFGFKNGGVYVEFKAVQVKTDAELRIVKLSNQEFYTRRLSAGDKTMPEFAFLGEIDFGEKKVNETIVLPQAVGFDVLSGERCSVYITVYSPNGIVLDKVLLNKAIDLTLTEYGAWTFAFETVDSQRNRNYKEETILVKDDILPIITTSDLSITEAKVGDVIDVPIVVATDNVAGKEIACYALVRNPDMQYAVVQDGKVKVDKKGTWLIIYYARDSEGNMTTKEFSISVK